MKPTFKYKTAGQLAYKLCLFSAFLFVYSCSNANDSRNATEHKTEQKIERKVAQKLILDIRYFCYELKEDEICKTPVTKLPPELADMITDTGIGGIVLFADNLENTEQILTLNLEIQMAAKKGNHPPLFIAIDQEGGRVVRLPEGLGTSFSGNMAIGATQEKHGLKYAKKSAEIIANELKVLGFNLNFAPTVDVNINPENPVINVRSYSEDPRKVAELGTAQMNAMQQQGVISTLKHFPGHGDTNVDSHTGLPIVKHTKQQIENVDLLPFQQAINTSSPGMIMTAHIQYPELDSTEFVDKEGVKTILPATMSKKILTDLLRTEMGFQGVVITDALDMAGISMFYDTHEAVLQTFNAGADIALMPLEINTLNDIQNLQKLIKHIAKAVSNNELDQASFEASVKRIASLKTKFAIHQSVVMDIEQAKDKAQQVLNSRSSRIVEQELATAAITEIKNNGLVPIGEEIQHIHLIMPDKTKCSAIEHALKLGRPKARLHCESAAKRQNFSSQTAQNSDLLIVADISPQQSLAEMGGMDDITHWRQRPDKTEQLDYLLNAVKLQNAVAKPVIFVSLRTPYLAETFAPFSDAIYATYAYNTGKMEVSDKSGEKRSTFQGVSFNALVDVLLGKESAEGQLPVSVSIEGISKTGKNNNLDKMTH